MGKVRIFDNNYEMTEKTKKDLYTFSVGDIAITEYGMIIDPNRVKIIMSAYIHILDNGIKIIMNVPNKEPETIYLEKNIIKIINNMMEK